MTFEELCEAARQIRQICEEGWCKSCPFYKEYETSGDQCYIKHTVSLPDGWWIRGDERLNAPSTKITRIGIGDIHEEKFSTTPSGDNVTVDISVIECCDGKGRFKRDKYSFSAREWELIKSRGCFFTEE